MEEFFYILQKIKNKRINVYKDKDNLENMPEMFKKVCRLCLTESDNLLLANKIYKQNIKYSKLVSNILNIDIVEPNEYFHNKICEECSSNLILFYKFKEKCEENNTVIMQLKDFIQELDETDDHISVISVTTAVKQEQIDTVKVKEDLDYDLALTVDPKEESALDINSIADIIDEDEMHQDVYIEQQPAVEEVEPARDFETVADIEEPEISEDEEEEEHIIIGQSLPSEKPNSDKEQVFNEEGMMVDERDEEISVVEYVEFDEAMDDEGEVEYLDIAWEDYEAPSVNADQKPNVLALSAVHPQLKAPRIKREPGVSVARRSKRSICTICGHAVDGQKKLDRHMGTHAPGYKGKKVTVKPDYPNYSETAVTYAKRPKKYTCPVCMHEIDSPSKLKTHMFRHMSNMKRQGVIKLEATCEEVEESKCPVEYICNYCSCMFPDSDCLMFHEEQHLKAHTPRQKKSHLCELCGMDLPNRSLYAAHMIKHTGEKPFKCELCEVRFTRKSQIAIHMRTHLNIKPYSCEVCGQKFSKSSNMYNHMVIHSSDRNFACEVCGKSFKRKTDVPKHMVCHTGERNFICKVCDKAYASRSGLLKHRRFHPDG